MASQASLDPSDPVPPASRLRTAITYPEHKRGAAPANKGKKFPPEPLTRAEVLRLIAACSKRGPSGLRNRALIVVMWRGGLRVGEAVALYLHDVDADAGLIRVQHGKGDKARPIGLDPMAMAIVQRWLAARAKLGITHRSPLFCTISFDPVPGRPLKTSYVRNQLKHAAAKAGITKRVHPHGLRHTHAFELADEDVPLLYIQKQLGHTSLATTQRYVDHLNPRRLVEAMQARADWSESG